MEGILTGVQRTLTFRGGFLFFSAVLRRPFVAGLNVQLNVSSVDSGKFQSISSDFKSNDLDLRHNLVYVIGNIENLHGVKFVDVND